MAVDPIPKGHHTVTPYLTVPGVARLIEFAVEAFGAVEVGRMQTPDGVVLHAQIRIGDSIVMLGEPSPAVPRINGRLYLYVKDVDATYRRALKAGATSLREPADQFYGDRNAAVTDPSGNMWNIATHVKDVSMEELQRFAQSMPPTPAKS